jgi:hypothetical protein
VSSIAAAGLTYLGLDVHRYTISVAVLGPGHEAPTVDRIANDEPSVRRLVARFPNRGRLRACYEAGPTGYELARLRDDPQTRAYAARRQLEGKSSREVRRCLERIVARQLFKLLERNMPARVEVVKVA